MEMKEPYLLSGDVTGSYQPAVRAQRSSPPLRIFVVIWLVAGLGFALWKFEWSRSVTRPSQATSEQAFAIGTEDMTHHLDALNGNLSEAEARLRRIDDQISRTLPAIQRNDLYVEKKRLENALAANEAVRHNLELARQQTDLVLNSLKEKLSQ